MDCLALVLWNICLLAAMVTLVVHGIWGGWFLLLLIGGKCKS